MKRRSVSSCETADEVLATRAATGDEVAFRHLVTRYLRPALAVAWEFTDTREDAEDVVQEAFRRAAGALGRFDPARRFSPWLFTILRNVARNHADARALRVHDALDEALPTHAPSPLDQVERLELETRVKVELDALPDMQRTCFRLCALEGMSSVEVAEALGVGDATVRTHVLRARQALRVSMMPFQEEVRKR